MKTETATDRPAPLDPMRLWRALKAVTLLYLAGGVVCLLLRWPAWVSTAFSCAVSLGWYLALPRLLRAREVKP